MNSQNKSEYINYKLQITKMKKYKSKHHFNYYILIHEKTKDGTIRKWETNEGRIIGKCKLDGTMKLEEMELDIGLCFCFTGASFKDKHDFELFKTIYETKLPCVKEVRKYDTKKAYAGFAEILGVSVPEKMIPKTYYELFSIIGVEKDENMKELQVISNDNEKYIIYQYPEAFTTSDEEEPLCLRLGIKDGIIFYGYEK